MKKKNRIYFFILFIITVLVFFNICRRTESGFQTDPKKMIVNKLESKIYYYDLILDSSNKKVFSQNLRNGMNEILRIDGEIEAIGERTRISRDSILIESFILYRKNKTPYLSFIKSINGFIEKSQYQRKYILPEIPIFCNAHYFYLHRSKYPKYKYNSFSLVVINNTFNDVKIFFSEKFDPFNNVKCMCDEIEVESILGYINQQFNFQ